MAERKFKDIGVTVYAAGPPSLVVVSWDFEESVIPLSRYTISIKRGESPEEMETIAKNIPAELFSEFEDQTAKIMDSHRTYYYQVIARNKKTGKYVRSKKQTWEGDLDLVGIYIIDEHVFKFRYVSGVPVFIFKKHTDGSTKCPDCWDSIAKRVRRSNCTTCHGTGNIGKGVGGYYNPTYTWADPNPDPEVIQIAQWGRVQTTQTDMFFINYPRLSVGDLVIEVTTDKRWKVSAVQDTEKRRTKMLQIVRLDLIDKNEVEYKIEVPKDIRVRALTELNEIKKEPEF
jgi:hypothetical protein